jgi:release factor glutamine methyltransferase
LRIGYHKAMRDAADQQPKGGPEQGGAGKPDAPRDARAMLAMARGFLEKKGVESARLEAELLVAHALGLDRLRLFLDLDRPVVPAEIDRARDLLVRRGRREPAHYILGSREFHGRVFAIGRGALVPRPETEHIVDRALERAKERAREGLGPVSSVLDMGAGSGCLATTLALELPEARVKGVDLSPLALEWARRNARALAPEALEAGRLVLELADMHAALVAGAPWDLVVANPPYIDERDKHTLAPEVRDWEPAEALFGPAGDPDRHAREILEAAPGVLAPGGMCLVELGHDQAARLRPLLARAQGLAARIHKDLAGHERVLELLRPA